jgi:hypothetical protein
MTGPHKLPDIAQLLSQAAELSRQAAELASQGHIKEALDLEQRADAFRIKARQAAQSNLKPTTSRRAAATDPNPPATQARSSLRTVTINALREIGVPASPQAVAEYGAARFGVPLDHRALPSLRRDERDAWKRRGEQEVWKSPRAARTVFLVPALEGNRFLAARGKLTLSDWPLERRIIGPWSERVNHLLATIQLARQLGWIFDIEPSSAERLRNLLARYAASIAGSNAEKLDWKKVEQAANAELQVINESDAEWRAQAAERAKGLLSSEQLLWGAPLPSVVPRTA